jgi:hypothetical protein
MVFPFGSEQLLKRRIRPGINLLLKNAASDSLLKIDYYSDDFREAEKVRWLCFMEDTFRAK